MSAVPETYSFLGQPHFNNHSASEDETAKLVELKKLFLSEPSISNSIGYGKTLAGMQRYHEALAVYTTALERWPHEHLLYAERGHMYVNLRCIEAAIKDLETAVELEPHNSDAWYHLGLANWFARDFARAGQSFARVRMYEGIDQSFLVAAGVWQYTALVKQGRLKEAATLLAQIDSNADMNGRNFAYQWRTRFYKGEISEQELTSMMAVDTKNEATLLFGLGLWHQARGNHDSAREYFERTISGKAWPAFGVSAAELELRDSDGGEREEIQGYSMLGQPLFSGSAISEDRRDELLAELESTKKAYEAQPDDIAAIRAYAKALAAGTSRYREAISLLTTAISRFPDEAMLWCDRGHYYLNIREFERALTDLRQASILDDSKFDIWYHMALVHWMRGDYLNALETFRKVHEVTDNESHQVAINDWLYLCLRRLGRDEEAAPLLDAIHPNMATTGNNHLYLKRLMFYKGELSEDEFIAICESGGLALASFYALGLWHMFEGNQDRAIHYFERVVNEGTSWGAFAHIAAESELLRRLTGRPEAVSRFGKTHYGMHSVREGTRDALAEKLRVAQQEHEANPDDPVKLIFHAKALDALGRYREGVELYSKGIERWPDNAMIRAHRGHRYLNIREFDRAREDLLLANEALPDNFDVLYHLGLVHYMAGEFEEALRVFLRTHEITSDEGDIYPTSALKVVAPAAILQIGTVDWIYMTLSRLGREEEGQAYLEKIDPDLPAGGNMVNYLARVRFYKGIHSEAEVLEKFNAKRDNLSAATVRYAIGNWHYARGNYDAAFNHFKEVLKTNAWPVFAYIAAESDLHRDFAGFIEGSK